jgi:CDP-4-dehydro-6-deoxyglucose reductase
VHTFSAEVSRIQDLTHDVRAIELRLLEPSSIAFKAGQFVSFEVPKEGPPRPVTRPYSIASPPGQRDRILLVLNLVQGGPGGRVICSAYGKESELRSRGRPVPSICGTRG